MYIIQHFRPLARLFFEREAKPLLRTLLGKFEKKTPISGGGGGAK